MPSLATTKPSSLSANKERLIWVDYAKGLGIFLVVYFHVIQGLFKAGILEASSIHTDSMQIVYTFHMPLFFLIAGLFARKSLEKTTPLSFVQGKLLRLMYPYLVWSLIMIGSKFLLANYVNDPMDLRTALYIGWEPVDTMWFLYSLFLCFLMQALFARKSPFILLFLSGALFLANNDIHFSNEIAFKFAQHFPFFALGCAFDSAILKRGVAKTSTSTLAGTALLFAVFGCLYLQESLLPPFVSGLLSGILGCALVIQLSVLLATNNRMHFLSVLGAASMPIYLMHGYFATVARIALVRTVGPSPTVLYIVGVTLVAILGPIILYRLISRNVLIIRLLGLDPPVLPKANPAVSV